MLLLFNMRLLAFEAKESLYIHAFHYTTKVFEAESSFVFGVCLAHYFMNLLLSYFAPLTMENFSQAMLCNETWIFNIEMMKSKP